MKAAPKVRLQLNTYNIIREAVEIGIRVGLNRAHKYADDPSRDTLQSSIEDAVMNQLCETVVF